MRLLRGDFEQAHAINTSALSPQEAGLIEEYSFLSSDFNISNGTQVFFAIAAEDGNSSRSEISNIARVVKFEPSPPYCEIDVVAIAVSGTLAAFVIVIAVIIYI